MWKNNKSVYHVTLFKDILMLKMHLCGQAGGSSEMIDSQINDAFQMPCIHLRPLCSTLHWIPSENGFGSSFL